MITQTGGADCKYLLRLFVLFNIQKFVADTADRQSWHNMIQLLPSSFNQMRTVTLNYENLINIYYARRTHKLAEWHTLCDWILSLPYAKDLIAIREE